MSQKESLNKLLEEQLPVVYSFLSKLGKRIYFPSSGIMAQAKEAKSASSNASIGIALNDDATSLSLSGVSSRIDLHSSKIFPYASSFGLQEFRENWVGQMLKKNPSLSFDNCTIPVVTSGLTHGLFICAQMFFGGETEILMPDLYWGNYKLIFEVNVGAKFVYFPFFVEQKFNLSALKKELFSLDKAVLLLNFPNNPGGYSLLDDEQDNLVELILNYANSGRQLLLICDDAYYGLFYESNVAKESLFARLADLHENIVVVKVDGPTKEEYVWGLRVGSIVVGNKNMSNASAKVIEDKLAGLVRSSVSNVSNLSQNLLVELYRSENYFIEKKQAFELLQSRYLEVKKWLNNNSDHKKYFEALPFNSGYFMCIKLNEGLDCEFVRQELLKKHSVGLISIKQNNLLRVAYSCLRKDEIKKVFEAIYFVCKLHKV
ncbi:hypothetical protein CL619_02815 [archaeon]|nr:hypothetical protein [archaeon]|tara:strand:- start:1107 stop:2399 length:1293 start_codon:yes stop_codon:yes gene_type:complete